MNEVIDGNEREVGYNVATSRGNHESREFTDPKEAAKAFHEIDANDRPHVTRVMYGPEFAPGGAGRVIAQTAGRGEPGKAIEYWKYSANQDSAFDAAYRELTGERIEAIDGNREAKDLAEHLHEATALRKSGREAIDQARAAEIGISTRADLYENAYLEAKKPALDAIAKGDVIAKLAELNRHDVEVVTQADARQWAELDAADFRKIENTERRADAGRRMAGIHSARYQQALQEIAPDVAEAVMTYERDKENLVSEKLVAELDARMAQSALEERGWRDRDDLEDVMHDLKRLAGHDWNRAAELWDKYRPNDIDKPVFIDGDDVDEKKPQTKTRDDEEKSSSRDTQADTAPAGDSDERESVTPASLRKRYLQAENKFYYRDDENKLAFEDKGKRLATEHNDPEIARSMVELAEAKGWNSIKLKGTDEFKREVWLHAELRGMQVQGFQPRDVDFARLADLRKEQERTADRGMNMIDQAPARARPFDRHEGRAKAPERTERADRAAVVDEHQRSLSDQQRAAVEAIKTVMRARGDSNKAVEMAAAIAAERFQTNRVYVGKVLEHGPAPYENNPKNESSYYVKLQTEAGERMVWGVDLPRAMEEGKVAVGDDVALAYQGRQPVTVKVKERDQKGNVVGEGEITTNRNTWDMRKLDQVREEVKQQLAERSGDKQPIVKVYDRDAPRTEVRAAPVRKPARENERARG